MNNLDDIKITPRDQQVLNLLVQGCSNKEIAKELNISARTVKLEDVVRCSIDGSAISVSSSQSRSSARRSNGGVRASSALATNAAIARPDHCPDEKRHQWRNQQHFRIGCNLRHRLARKLPVPSGEVSLMNAG